MICIGYGSVPDDDMELVNSCEQIETNNLKSEMVVSESGSLKILKVVMMYGSAPNERWLLKNSKSKKLA